MLILMYISDLPLDIKLKILSHVRDIRKPKQVLSFDLKNDIQSYQWLKVILQGMERFYPNGMYYLGWIESDLLFHLNDYKSIYDHLSTDIRRYYSQFNRNQIIDRLMYVTLNPQIKKKNIYIYWNMMNMTKRRMFASKYQSSINKI